MNIDVSEVLELVADLRAVPAAATPKIEKAVEVTARNVKDDWKQGAGVSRADWNFADDYASSIDYDKLNGGGAVEAEIGPNLGRAGGSAGFLEEGGGGVRSAPQHAGRDALEANEADFVRGLEIAILEALAEKI